MKLVIREYLASLRERGELDAVLPDFLTELGYTVYSRPGRGTRQYGVDVAAVGLGQDGITRVHLFSVKSGDLGRADWDTASPQSLRPSLNEILDVYVTSRIPPEYADLPIAICLCFGGAIDEQVRAEVVGFMNRNKTDKISFEEWNGDRLAEVVLAGVLREEILPAPLRSHLRKAVAMVEEPEIAIDHFAQLIRALIARPGVNASARLSQARLINICLWIMFVWGREAHNVEASYRASELAMLEIWHLLNGDIAKAGRSVQAASLVFNEIVELHFTVWGELFDRKILPFADTRHALSTAVESHAAVDINLKLFDMIGRIALRGLWLAWQASESDLPTVLPESSGNASAPVAETLERIDLMCGQLVDIISNNRALLSPLGDWQAIDIALVLTLFASRQKYHAAIDQWVEELTNRTIFAFQTHGRYPTTSRSYWDLVEHPEKREDDYRRGATEGSILYPMLALWAAARGQQKVVDAIARFKEKELSHCTFQTWLPDEDSETHLYLGSENHGVAFTGLPVTVGSTDPLDLILEEIATNPHFDALSAIALGHWPILMTACRRHRLPVPPNVWRDLLPALRPSVAKAETTSS